MMTKDIQTFLSDGCGRCEFFATDKCKVRIWKEQVQLLREIILKTGLREEMKWGVPVYTYNGSNIINLSALKSCATIGFFKGALLKDEHKILLKPGENSQAVKQLKVTQIDDIHQLEPIIKSYIFEAIEIEKAGLKIEFKKEPEPMPEELKTRLAEFPELKEAFEALTPGRQRGYILHFSQPKQSKTRISRIEKCIPKILEGKGFHDR